MYKRICSQTLPTPAFLFGLVAIFCISGVMAETVYKWTDTAGITHFSQNIPPQDPAIVEIIEFDALTPPPQGVNDYYSVVNQARRMETARRKREQENLDRRLAVKRAQQAEQEESEAYPSDTVYIPVYTYYGYKRPYRTGYYRRKPDRGHYSGYRPGVGKHPRPVPYQSGRRRHYPRAVISTDR
jgi:hypothetical protein